MGGDKAKEYTNSEEREIFGCNKMISSGDEYSPTMTTSAITSTPINQSKLSRKKRDLPRTLFSRDDGLVEEVKDNLKQKNNVSYQGDGISYSKLQKRIEYHYPSRD